MSSSSSNLFATHHPLNFISQRSSREQHHSPQEASGTGSTTTSTTSTQTPTAAPISTSTQTRHSSLSLTSSSTTTTPIQTDSPVSHIKSWLKCQTSENKLESKRGLSRFLKSGAIRMMRQMLEKGQIGLNYDVNWNEDVNDVALVSEWGVGNGAFSGMPSLNKGGNEPGGKRGGNAAKDTSSVGANAAAMASSSSSHHQNLKVAHLAWNDQGHLAVSYEPQHSSTLLDGWCMDSGLILVKRGGAIMKRLDTSSGSAKVSTSSSTDLRIDVSESIVTALDFYPGRGNILAAGTYDGTLKVWKLGKQTEKLICESRVHELYSHRDPISQISWLKTRADRSIVLASMSTEGRFSIWTVKNDFMQPIAIYMVNDIEGGGLSLGVTCFSFSNIHAGASIRSMNRSSIIPTTDNFFVFGTEIGRVARTTLNGGKLLDTKAYVKGASLPETKPKTNGVEFEYDSGIGYVHTVECSPYHKNLCMSATSEGLIRLYNVYQSTDILTLQPCEQMIYDAQWSPFRPCVLAAAAEDGHLYIFDLTESTVTPAVDIAVSTHPVTQVKFDPENPEHIVTGDAEGFIKVWRLNNRLSSLQPHELTALQSIASGQTFESGMS
eukprot:CAMPEP_0117452698 /NCGR_PEP_ID=MMETSP0759-20121206/9772_1 /TAXON_ID=63605 /ORGANISM="Percolomonas cosmopolitus, Strain WS" /LENGTH=605 /DNA_ID=CAMNT_0005245567 /DNA_START=850 /DNA_END=2667 /DNA_ORIENTATION=+